MSESQTKLVRIDITLTGDLAEKFTARRNIDGDVSNNALARRLILLKLNQDEKQAEISTLSAIS